MREKELDYFRIDGEYGGDQDWFPDFWMRLGGCAAETACDCSIYFTLFRGKNLYPFDVRHLTKIDYVAFGMRMKPYIRPRAGGVDRLELYFDGYGKYLRDAGETGITMEGVPGEADLQPAAEAMMDRIDRGIPVPVLTLRHESPAMSEYIWHWYILNGYRETDAGKLLVKAVTYGEWEWLDFSVLWRTGRRPKGGLVLFRMDAE